MVCFDMFMICGIGLSGYVYDMLHWSVLICYNMWQWSVCICLLVVCFDMFICCSGLF